MARVSVSVSPTIPPLTVENETSTTPTVNSDDCGKYIRFTGSGPFSVTADPITTDFVGEVISLRNESGGAITVAAGVGVTLNGLVIFQDGEAVNLVVVGTNEYDVIGATS